MNKHRFYQRIAVIIMSGFIFMAYCQPVQVQSQTYAGIDFRTQYEEGEIIEAESGNQEHVQAAIDLAKDGDTVLIPAGDWEWKTLSANQPAVGVGKQLKWGEEPKYASKSITIKGAGMGKTNIIDKTGTKHRESALLIFLTDDKPVRVSGLTFLSDETSGQKGIEIANYGRNWRIDHCSFVGQGHYGRGVVATGEGVIDHCYFNNLAQGVTIFGKGDQSWAEPLMLGSEKAVFIEDCEFEYDNFYDGALDAYNGAALVFRHNYVKNTHCGTHGRDSGGYRSTRACEYYENTFESVGVGQRSLGFRGGTGVIFNNTWSSEGESWERYIGILLLNYCSCPENYLCGWNPVTEYPGTDQAGRSTDLRLLSEENQEYEQLLEPIYAWNNVNNGKSEIIKTDSDTLMKEHIQENRDYYNNTPRPGYKPYPYPHPYTQQFPPATKNDLEAPGIPSGFSATATDLKIALDWNKTADSGDSGLAGYYIWLDGKKVTSNSDPDYTQYVFLGLNEGQTYQVQVSAYDNAGNESVPCEGISVLLSKNPSVSPSPTPTEGPSPTPTKGPSPMPTKRPSPNPSKPDASTGSTPAPVKKTTPSITPEPTSAPSEEQTQNGGHTSTENLITTDYPEMARLLELLYDSANIRYNILNPTYGVMMRREPVISLTAGYQKQLRELAKLTFIDIRGDEWYAHHIPMAVYRKLIKGFPDRTFKGGNLISRAEVLTMLSRFNSSEELIRQNAQQDTESWIRIAEQIGNDWYTHYVVAAKDGLVYPDLYTRESILQPMTRGEVIYALANSLWKEELREGGTYYMLAEINENPAFNDTLKTIHISNPDEGNDGPKCYCWYKQFMYAAENPEMGVPMDFYPSIMCLKDKGILLGNNGESKWYDPITRAEALALFERLARVWGEESNLEYD
jgi:hypothetical protein